VIRGLLAVKDVVAMQQEHEIRSKRGRVGITDLGIGIKIPVGIMTRSVLD
jgi:hypothetical protein